MVPWLLPIQALLALCLLAGSLYPAFALTRILLPELTSISLRWAAILIIWLWLAGLAFHLLAALKLFHWASALFLTLLVSGIVYLMGYRFSAYFKDLKKLLDRCNQWAKELLAPPHQWVIWIHFIWIGVIGLRAILLPILGWDAMTSHIPKAAFWVQGLTYDILESPGMWGQSYRHFFGGAGVFTAWVMMPFHSDLMTGLWDAAQWLMIGFAAYLLGKEVGLISKVAWIGAAYILFIPSVWQTVGGGNVENLLYSSLLFGLVFILRFLKDRRGVYLPLAGMALGLVVSIKPNLVTIGFLLFVGILPFIYTQPNARKSFSWYLVGGACAVAAVTPWLVLNSIRTGYPLGALPVSLGPLQLGFTSTSIEWFSNRPELASVTWLDELLALARMFRSPLVYYPHNSVISITSVFLALLNLPRLWVKSRGIFFVVTSVIVGNLIFFYLPEFKVIRIVYDVVTARFLLPIIIVSTFVSLKAYGRPHALLLGAATFIHIAAGAFVGWGNFEYAGMALWALVLSGVLWIVKTLKKFSAHAHQGSALVFACLVVLLLAHYRQETRMRAYAESEVSGYVYNYWTDAAASIDQASPLKIAVTSGPDQNLHNWFMSPFLGSRLQNELVYIPVTIDGTISDFDAEYSLRELANEKAWLDRISEQQVDCVLSFAPQSLELAWLEKNPDWFERVSGDGNNWGLYEVHLTDIQLDAKADILNR